MFYVKLGDRTVPGDALCTSPESVAAAAGGAADKLCMNVSAMESVCRPRVRLPRNAKERKKGGMVVWYNCQRPGMCRIRAAIQAAPNPVVMHWTKVCAGAPVSGLDIGTLHGSPDVVKDGKVSLDWLPTPYAGGDDAAQHSMPTSVVHASETETTFYIDVTPDDPSERVFLHAMHLGVWAPPPPHRRAGPLLTLQVAGPVPRDIVALTRFAGRRGVENAARGRKGANVAMSSTMLGHNASLATDGDTGDLMRGHLACAISGLMGRDPEPYWEIDLGRATARTSIVKSVVVWNTPAGDARYRLVPFWVLLSSTSGRGGATTFPRSLAGAKAVAQYMHRFDTVRRTYRWVVPQNDAFTRRVRIQLEQTDLLMLSEVEVNVVRPQRRCPDPVADNVDPLCEELDHQSTIRSVVKYACHRPGTAVINMVRPEIPQYPA